MRSVTILVALLVAALALTACGGTADRAAPTKTVTVAPPSATSATAPVSTPTALPSSAKAPATKKIRVPDVVGKNHQTAQNIMQAAGLWMLQEEDVTGQGRMLILDRNWQVVRQKPKAGTSVTPEATITLYSKKIGE
ncbi:PASTA domain-containing protein [Actinomadura mexicana]|uniref:PASTA domain-containing protein n=1 Tax=Actinomadura mexicana TaxID=134959 RepID=A0A239A8W0_9ACTN|nr:PASTA domain-containing protein [Actinomadura mexicana]SNR91771.1 PASTA domain-containing protein [Actinomadura mexicana]